MKLIFRWLAVLPGALLAIILSPFPLHFILYSTLTGSGFIEPYPELPERLLTPFFAALLFQWVGVKIAPSRKKETSIILLVLWIIFFLFNIIFFIANPKIGNTNFYFRYGILGPISAFTGAIIGFYINKKTQWFINNSNEDNKTNLSNILKEGSLYYNKCDYQKALNKFEYFITVDNKNKYAYYYRALTNNKLGNKSEMLSDLKMAAKLGHQKAIDFLQRKGIDY